MSQISGGVISAVATVVVVLLLARKRGVQVRGYLTKTELARIVTTSS